MYSEPDPWPRRATNALGVLTGTAYGWVDDRLNVRWASDSYRRIFGIEPLGRSLFDFIHPEDLGFATSVVLFYRGNEAPARADGGVLERVAPGADVRLLNHDGTYRTCWVSVENHLDHPDVCALVVRLDCIPDRSGIGRSLDLIAAGAPLAEIGQCIAEFVPQDFDPRLNLCVALTWHHENERHVVASRRDYSPTMVELLSHASLDLPDQFCEEISVMSISQLATVAPDAGAAAIDEGFAYLWRIPIQDPESEEPISMMLVWSTTGYTLSLRPEMHVSIGRHLFKLALIEQRRRHRLIAAATTDSLSGLMNRAGLHTFFDSLSDAQFPVLAVLVDLDEFKSVNDRFGHGAGDVVIAATGRRLASFCGPTSSAARLGGDEFVFITTRYHGAVEEAAASVASMLSVPVTVSGHDLEIAASAGGALAQDRAALGDLLERADLRLYEDKTCKYLVDQ